jgi:hypothetical protein
METVQGMETVHAFGFLFIMEIWSWNQFMLLYFGSSWKSGHENSS